MNPGLALAAPEELLLGLKRWVVATLPAPLQEVGAAALSGLAVLLLFAGLFALVTVLERKGLGRIQNRPGPNRVGPYGLLQPLADGVKMLVKEDIVPTAADPWVHYLAPFLVLVPAALAMTVIPIGRGLVALDLEAGLLFFFAVGSAAEVGAFMAGWASRNKYSILGAMRAIAQMVSFELPLVLSTLAVVMMSGSLSLVEIVRQQGQYTWGLPAWNVWTPWGLAGFLVFLVAATAESNRSPFDLPEGESEIIGGFMTEYSGFKYAMFFMGEYFGMFAVSGLAITLFLGGWHAPLSFLTWVPSFVWFFLKLAALLAWFIWVRGTLPRVRVDQLMNFAWKFLLPLSLLNLIVAILWRFTAAWSFLGSWGARWLLGAGLVAFCFVALARRLTHRHRWGPRAYRYAS